MTSNVPASLEPSNYIDPTQAYRNKVKELEAESRGIEYLAYRVFGRDVIGSLALALNPYASFVMTDKLTSGVTRTQKKFLPTSKITIKEHKVHTFDRDNGSPVGPQPKPRVVTTTTTDKSFDVTTPKPYWWQMSDTTKKTREHNQPFGELEQFKFEWKSKPFSYSWNRTDVLTMSGGTGWSQYGKSDDIMTMSITPESAYFFESSFNALYNEERNRTLFHISDQATSMIPDALPEHRDMSLFRSIVELRELPFTIEQSVKSVRDLIKARGIPVESLSSAFLSKEFGWDPIFNDLRDLLTLPSKVANRVNYLMARQLKDTTFRTRRTFTEPVSSLISPTLVSPKGMSVKSTKTSSVRDIELRVVINAFVQLPQLDAPELRDDLFNQFMGLKPNPVDLYDLIPWTWLIDWFSGLGDYIEAIVAINSDKSLVNWGLITCENKRTSTTTQQVQASTTVSRNIYGSSSTVFKRWLIERTERYETTFHIRKDLSTVAALKTTADPTLLDPWQAAIVGALLALRM